MFMIFHQHPSRLNEYNIGFFSLSRYFYIFFLFVLFSSGLVLWAFLSLLGNGLSVVLSLIFLVCSLLLLLFISVGIAKYLIKDAMSSPIQNKDESIELTPTQVILITPTETTKYTYSDIEYITFLNYTPFYIQNALFYNLVRNYGVYVLSMKDERDIYIPSSYENRDVLVQEIINKAGFVKGDIIDTLHNPKGVFSSNGRITWIKGESSNELDHSAEIYQQSRDTSKVKVLIIFAFLVVVILYIYTHLQ
jgi:hypothetical protein